MNTEGEEDTLVFYYILENTTAIDYRFPSSPTILVKLERQKSLIEGPLFVHGDTFTFIPAGQRLRFGIHLQYPYEQLPKGFFLEGPISSALRPFVNSGEPIPKEQRPHLNPDEFIARRYQRGARNFVKEYLPNHNGFVLYDEENHYQIDFPKGW